MVLHFHEPTKLKTKRIIFEDVYAVRDANTLEHLKELSSKRRLIEDSLNQGSSQLQQDLQKLERYLPLLLNLVFHVDLVSSNNTIVEWTSKLKIRWSSAISSSFFFNLRGPKFYQIDNIRFELGMVLFLYGAMLRERAFEVLQEDLVKSATLFREAAGVFHYLSQEVLPTLQPALPAEKPPEATSYLSNVMSLICLAEAQAVTIRKAEEKGTTVGLLAKLNYGVVEILGEAADALYSANGACKDISSRFVEFLSSFKALHEFRSQKYLAENLRVNDQLGVAIGVLHDALINLRKKMPKEESHKSVFRKEIDIVGEMIRKFEHENDFVCNEKIASSDELPVPQGSKIVKAIPYQPIRKWEHELVFKM